MDEKRHNLIDYLKSALNKTEGATNVFLLKQDLEEIIKWKTERDAFEIDATKWRIARQRGGDDGMAYASAVMASRRTTQIEKVISIG